MAKNKGNAAAAEGTSQENLDATQEAPKVKIEIVRGRMPVAVVAMIRFHEKGVSTSALAAKYRTTIGKIDDILKGRNFGYISESFQPSAQQVTDAKAYLEQLSTDNAANTLEKLENMGVAEDGGAGFEEARKAARKTKGKPAPAAAPAAEGGDNVEGADMSEFTD